MRPRTMEMGCLMLGGGEFMRALSRRLADSGAQVERAEGETLDAARDGLFRISRCARVCAAAAGKSWPAALALAAQLRVDRLVLLRPELSAGRSPAEAFARRNLFFCVSEILIFDGADEAMLKETDALCRGLCNAQIWRAPGGKDDAQIAARFLLAEDAQSAFPSERGAVTLC